MRRILIDTARRKSSRKHGGDQERFDVAVLDLAEPTPDEKLLLINEPSKRRSGNIRNERIVVLKFFRGLKNQEVAGMLGRGERTMDLT